MSLSDHEIGLPNRFTTEWNDLCRFSGLGRNYKMPQSDHEDLKGRSETKNYSLAGEGETVSQGAVSRHWSSSKVSPVGNYENGVQAQFELVFKNLEIAKDELETLVSGLNFVLLDSEPKQSGNNDKQSKDTAGSPILRELANVNILLSSLIASIQEAQNRLRF